MLVVSFERERLMSLDITCFLSTEDADEEIKNWREEYNYFRPHGS
jgi:putative transposase